MKKNLTIKLLEILKDGSLDAFDLFIAFTISGYGASVGKIEHNYYKRIEKRNCGGGIDELRSKISKDDWNKINDRFRAVVSRLHSEGLVERSERGKNGIVKITEKGKKKLIDTKSNIFPDKDYEFKKSSSPLLFMFDIPEKQRNKRAWLRSVLVRMEFQMIQKSVWLGRVKIPEEFLEDLRKLRIIQFIEILEITKTGTLKVLS
jgi:CRISPR/Cas system-associated endoribonuclease Cas2